MTKLLMRILPPS